jgi:NAD(P)-dependent dehydrogenase (short-subunit alcohol dehydrogenase family)
MTGTSAQVAVVTGASRGLGEALTGALVERGWQVVVSGRSDRLLDVARRGGPAVTAVLGDVTDPVHRDRLVAAAARAGGAGLLVNNAGELGPSPLPALADLPPAELLRVLEVGVVAPLALVQALLPQLRAARGTVVDLSSDAAVQPYAGWGGYGSAKAALDQVSAVLGVEEPDLRVYAFDPGDMRTAMHQAAFPGEDIGDRPTPAEVAVPALLRLLAGAPPSGRYRALRRGGGRAAGATGRAAGRRAPAGGPARRRRARGVPRAAAAARAR